MKDRSVGDQGEALGPRTARGYSEGQVWGVMGGEHWVQGLHEVRVKDRSGVWGGGEGVV